MKSIYALLLITSVFTAVLPADSTRNEAPSKQSVTVASRSRNIVSPTVDVMLTLGAVASFLAAFYIDSENCYGTYDGTLKGYAIQAEANAAKFISLTCLGALVIKKNIEDPRLVGPLLACSPLLFILCGLSKGINGLNEAAELVFYKTPCFCFQTLRNLWTRS
jgi:hypothetical protein